MPVQWREISGSPGNWTLAGPRDTPPSSTAGRVYARSPLTSGPIVRQARRETRGAAAAALVQFASGALHQMSVNVAMRHELEAMNPQVESVLERAPEGHGVIAVISYEVARNGQTRITGRAVESAPSRSFRVAVNRWSRQTRLHGGVYAHSPLHSARRRYFWGTYAPPPEPLTPGERSSTASRWSRRRVGESSGRP